MEALKVESFHADGGGGGGGGNRKNSIVDPLKPRRTSRAGPTLELPAGSTSPSVQSGGKRLSGTIPNSTRRRSSNVIPGGRRASSTPTGYRRQKVLLENTYRMEPIIRFRPDHALNVLREVFERRLRGSKYDAKLGQEMARTLAGEVKVKVKDLRVDRYKYVVVVTVGQRQESELIIASRCLLDIKCDTYAAYNFENFHLFATGIVYAFYYE